MRSILEVGSEQLQMKSKTRRYFCRIRPDQNNLPRQKTHWTIAILQNNAFHPIYQSVKYCARNLCRASARLQISSLSFALCQIVLPALFYWIAIEEKKCKRWCRQRKEVINMKKLCRSYHDRKICGVCGWIGEYLGVDPTVVRLVFVVLGLLHVGIILYIAAAILMPTE